MMTTLQTPFLTILALLFVSGCYTTGPFDSRDPHRPEITVKMPTELNEREERRIGSVADTLEAAGYNLVPNTSRLPARYTLWFDIKRKGPIAIYAYLSLEDETERSVAKGDSSQSALSRLIAGESAYDDVFDQCLRQFQQSLPPAESRTYQRTNNYRY